LVSAGIVVDTTDAHEAALQECIRSKELQEVYLKFCVEEFTTGELALPSSSGLTPYPVHVHVFL
jgi:hypothetical protein